MQLRFTLLTRSMAKRNIRNLSVACLSILGQLCGPVVAVSFPFALLRRARVDAGRPRSNSDTCSGVYLAYTRRILGEYLGARPAANCPPNPPGRRTSRVECIRQAPRAQLIPELAHMQHARRALSLLWCVMRRAVEAESGQAAADMSRVHMCKYRGAPALLEGTLHLYV